MNQVTTSPESQTVRISPTIQLVVKSELMVMVWLVLYFVFNSVLYYGTLFFPTLSGAAILLIAAMLGGYGGIICCLLFLWLARSIFSQYHRMTTYQRYKLCFSV